MSKTINSLKSACKGYEEDVVLYYYGDCAEAERARVEEHLQQCGSCRGFLNDLRSFLPKMVESKELPQSFWDGYYEELQAKLAARQQRHSWWREFFTLRRPWAIPAMGTAAVVVLGLAFVLSSGTWHIQRGSSSEEVPQEILADAGKIEFFKAMDLLESLPRLEAMDKSRSDADAVHRL